jgi:hypothetical protein
MGELRLPGLSFSENYGRAQSFEIDAVFFFGDEEALL